MRPLQVWYEAIPDAWAWFCRPCSVARGGHVGLEDAVRFGMRHLRVQHAGEVRG